MTFPVHEIKHVKASHRKYQFLTILFTIVTLAATLGAAFSSIQLSNLKKERQDLKKMAEESASPPQTPVIVNDSAMKEIEALKSELDREKSTSLKMKAKIKDLNNQISALKKAVVTPKPKAAPVAQPKPKAAPVTQPKPAAPTQPPQEKEPASKVTPPAPPQLPANQEVEPTPSPATGSPAGQEPSAPAPQQPVSPKPAPAPIPEVPASDAGTPSDSAAEESVPKPEPEQPLTAPPVTDPSGGQPQTEDLPSKTGDEEPDSKVNP